MEIRNIIRRLRETKVLENYSFMTALNIFSALISLIIYPFVIRATGKEAYGTYVYALTIASFFQAILNYGFDSPCAKAIVQACNDLEERCRIVTCVLVLKTSFIVLCGSLFAICMHIIPFMQTNSFLCVICFIQLVAQSLFPVWYFQGMKQMKHVTYINISLRLSTIPFIIWMIHSPQDIKMYAIIIMVSYVLCTIIAYSFLYVKNIRLKHVSFAYLRRLISDSTPFFATSITCELKSLTVKTIIKQFFGVGSVALYDFAEKLVSIPRFFTQNINAALFPEVVNNAQKNRVQRILKYERIIGLTFCVLIALFSYPAVLILGGREMIGALSLTIILSGTLYTSLIAGAYINFVFIPSNRYYTVTLNQIIAFMSCVVLSMIGLYIWRDVNMVALGLTCAGFIEILFCKYYTKWYL